MRMTWAPRDGRRAVSSILVFLLALLSLALSGCATLDQRGRRAAQLEEQGQYAAALAQYEDVLARIDARDHTRLAATYVKVGECLWHLGRPDDASGAFDRALTLDPANVEAHLRTAELYVAQAPDRALAEARIVLGLQPANAEAFSVMGAAYSSVGQLPLAKLSYQRSLELDPQRASVAVALADLQYRGLDAAAARSTLRQAASALPRSAMPWLALGRLEEQEGDADAAEEAYRHAVAAEDTPETN